MQNDCVGCCVWQIPLTRLSKTTHVALKRWYFLTVETEWTIAWTSTWVVTDEQHIVWMHFTSRGERWASCPRGRLYFQALSQDFALGWVRSIKGWQRGLEAGLTAPGRGGKGRGPMKLKGFLQVKTVFLHYAARRHSCGFHICKPFWGFNRQTPWPTDLLISFAFLAYFIFLRFSNSALVHCLTFPQAGLTYYRLPLRPWQERRTARPLSRCSAKLLPSSPVQPFTVTCRNCRLAVDTVLVWLLQGEIERWNATYVSVSATVSSSSHVDTRFKSIYVHFSFSICNWWFDGKPGTFFTANFLCYRYSLTAYF